MSHAVAADQSLPLHARERDKVKQTLSDTLFPSSSVFSSYFDFLTEWRDVCLAKSSEEEGMLLMLCDCNDLRCCALTD